MSFGVSLDNVLVSLFFVPSSSELFRCPFVCHRPLFCAFFCCIECMEAWLNSVDDAGIKCVEVPMDGAQRSKQKQIKYIVCTMLTNTFARSWFFPFSLSFHCFISKKLHVSCVDLQISSSRNKRRRDKAEREREERTRVRKRKYHMNKSE